MCKHPERHVTPTMRGRLTWLGLVIQLSLEFNHVWFGVPPCKTLPVKPENSRPVNAKHLCDNISTEGFVLVSESHLWVT